MSVAKNLQKWKSAGLIDQATFDKITQYEQQASGNRFTRGMLWLGAFSIVLGIMAVVGSNWDAIPAYVKLAVHVLISVSLAMGIYWSIETGRNTLKEILLPVFAGFILAFFALMGQIYQTGAPLWQVAGAWLLMVSPFLFLYARARGTIVLWVIGYGCFAGTVLAAIGGKQYAVLSGVLMALLAMTPAFVGQAAALRERWEKWPEMLSLLFYVALVIAASSSQALWSWDVRPLAGDDRSFVLTTLGMGVMGAALMVWLRARRILVQHDYMIDVFFAVSLLAMYLPSFVPHDRFVGFSVIGALCFCAYWAFVGWIALRFHMQGILNLAISLIAIRLFIIYCEVFGSMLSTGIGLIISGLVLIGMVQGTRKIIARVNSYQKLKGGV